LAGSTFDWTKASSAMLQIERMQFSGAGALSHGTTGLVYLFSAKGECGWRTTNPRLAAQIGTA